MIWYFVYFIWIFFSLFVQYSIYLNVIYRRITLCVHISYIIVKMMLKCIANLRWWLWAAIPSLYQIKSEYLNIYISIGIGISIRDVYIWYDAWLNHISRFLVIVNIRIRIYMKSWEYKWNKIYMVVSYNLFHFYSYLLIYIFAWQKNARKKTCPFDWTSSRLGGPSSTINNTINLINNSADNI